MQSWHLFSERGKRLEPGPVFSGGSRTKGGSVRVDLRKITPRETTEKGWRPVAVAALQRLSNLLGSAAASIKEVGWGSGQSVDEGAAGT